MKLHPTKLLYLLSALACGGALLAPALRADDVPAANPAPAVKDAARGGLASPSSADAGKKKRRRKKKKKNKEDDSSGSSAPAQSGAPGTGS